ncbi:OmpW/AlkL family protein [Acinetobacter equi]|uniref:OmpW family protein n=1 Tax=Acinetobacter equi TaxID=1324350 RepID=A0A0N9VE43_9GAMM|nr:OmpW family outer membrane protein [Acinetobacter equi]ALH95632.1 hypothetical protein AOY20_08880 [Acinetobacter equi]
MKKSPLYLSVAFFCFPIICHAESSFFNDLFSEGDGFKRFSVSAGWLYSNPTGKANPVQVNTAVKKGKYEIGPIKIDTVRNSIAKTPEGETARKGFEALISQGKRQGAFADNIIPQTVSGYTQIDSLEAWSNPNTGLKAQSVNTVGLLMNYHITDNWSIQFKGGIPPKVDIAGIGQINAPIKGLALPEGRTSRSIANEEINSAGPLPIDTTIPITNLQQSKIAATARAWLPATEIQYQFGKSGVNKFRPYIGVGIVYAHFTHVKLNKGIERDLIAAGHNISNTLNNRAGAAMEKQKSSADPVVKVKATDAFAPVITLGATYDFNDKWYAVASVSYSKMSNKSIITLTDRKTGKELQKSTTKINIDPLITYMGIGYRF